jgi:CubicO group peptidase (beta-lactamase class C family)
MNAPAIRAQPIVSFGGIGSASALAKFYSMLANGGKADGQIFFSAQTLGWMSVTLKDGIDCVFQIPTAFSAGFMKDPQATAATPASLREAAAGRVSSPPNQGKGRIGNRPSLDMRRMFGPSRISFGHPGAGGSQVFCDPENRIAFAYVMNQMEQSLLPNEKSLRLVDAIYG